MKRLTIFTRLLTLLFIILLTAAGCKKDSGSETVQPEPEKPAVDTVKKTYLKSLSQGDLNINNLDMVLNNLGVMGDSETPLSYSFFKSRYNNSLSIEVPRAGLWLAIDEPAPRINMTGYIGYNYGSNFSSVWDTVKAGLFHITPDLTRYAPPSNLRLLGFPVDKYGKIRLFGDEMYWTALHGYDVRGNAMVSHSSPEIWITQAVYAFKSPDLKNVLFIRYDFTNTSPDDYNNIYAGYFSDTDLGSYYNFNSIGFDYQSGLSYNYDSRSVHSTDSTLISAFTFLASPLTDPQLPYGISSHRIIRRYESLTPGFGQPNNNSDVIYSLKGLSSAGGDMIDPVTKKATKYAFTGDPYAGTGWIDDPCDTRNLISAGPFSLKSQERKTLIVVWICSDKGDFRTCLSDIKLQLDYIRNNRSLWE